MVGGHLGPGRAPAAGPADRVRATPGLTAYGWTGSGPIPSGRTSPEPARVGRGGETGFVAGPGPDRDERRAADREPAGWSAGRSASWPSASEPPSDPRAWDEAAAGGGPAARLLCGRRRGTMIGTRTRSRQEQAGVPGHPGHPGRPGRRGRRGPGAGPAGAAAARRS